MKKILDLTVRYAGLMGMIFMIAQAFGQQVSINDARSALGENYTPLKAPGQLTAADNFCLYLLDDGSLENSVGLTAGGDVMWLNYFTAAPGCEIIETIEVAWGLMSNGGPSRLFIYEDPDDDGNPDDAVLLVETTTTVVNANLSLFSSVSITPTQVSGGFFIAALCQNHLPGEFPAPLDQTASMGKSWIVAASPAGSFNVNMLTNNVIPPGIIDGFGFPGNWMLRAAGGGSQTQVPLSDWMIFIGFSLIVVYSIYRFRK